MKQKSKSEKELLSIFETLSETEQSIVCLSSVIYDYATRSSLVTCLSRIGVRDEKGRGFKLTTLDPILEKLDKTKIIEFSDNGIRINHGFLAKATQICIKDGKFETLSEVVQKVIGLKDAWGDKEFRSYSQAIRDIRIAILTMNFQEAQNCLQKCFDQYSVYYSEESPYDIIFNRPFDIAFFQTLPVEIYSEALINFFKNSILILKPEKKPFSFLLSLIDLNQENSIPENLQNILAEQLIFRGRFNEALELIQNKNTIDTFIFQGWIEFLLNNNEKAIDSFQNALALKKKGTTKRTIYLFQIGGIFYILALLKNKNATSLQQANNYISKVLKDKNYFYADIYKLFQQIIMVFNEADISLSFSILSQTDSNDSLFQYFLALVSYWIDQSKSKAYLRKLKELYNRALSCEYDWFAAEIAELIVTIDNTEHVYRKFAENFHKTHKTRGLISAVKIPEPWEHSLNALIKLKDVKKEQKSITSSSRLAWFISSEYGFSMHPKEQNINAKGEWTKGRPIALKRLNEEMESFNFISEQDKEICSCIYSEYESSGYGYYRKLCYYMNEEKAFPLLIGHPFVFWESSPNTPIEIVKKSPELLIQDNVHHFTIQLYPKIRNSRPMELIKESPSRLVIFELTVACQREFLNTCKLDRNRYTGLSKLRKEKGEDTHHLS